MKATTKICSILDSTWVGVKKVSNNFPIILVLTKTSYFADVLASLPHHCGWSRLLLTHLNHFNSTLTSRIQRYLGNNLWLVTLSLRCFLLTGELKVRRLFRFVVFSIKNYWFRIRCWRITRFCDSWTITDWRYNCWFKIPLSISIKRCNLTDRVIHTTLMLRLRNLIARLRLHNYLGLRANLDLATCKLRVSLGNLSAGWHLNSWGAWCSCSNDSCFWCEASLRLWKKVGWLFDWETSCALNKVFGNYNLLSFLFFCINSTLTLILALILKRGIIKLIVYITFSLQRFLS